MPTVADLPTDAAQGDAYIVQGDNSFRVWDATSSTWVDGGSIQGPQGIAGPQRPQGLQGEPGPQGLQGVEEPAGAQGNRGTAWFTGSGSPTTLPGAMPGVIYLDLTRGDLYLLSSGPPAMPGALSP